MSQRQELAIKRLEARVASLEDIVERLLSTSDAPVETEGPYKARHKHMGQWIIEDGNGNVLTHYGEMKKAEALSVEHRLNGQD